MGVGYEFECPKCGNEETIDFEVGMLYPHLLNEFKKKALSGEFGKEWKELASKNSDSRVDAEMFLYRCPECKSWKNEPSYDVYYPKDGVDVSKKFCWSSEGYELVKEYPHMCKCCNKPMKKYKSIGRLKLKCPKCGQLMNRTESICLWD